VSGPFKLLSMGARNLSTTAQATTGNNPANATTPGYSRRRTLLMESQPGIGLADPSAAVGGRLDVVQQTITTLDDKTTAARAIPPSLLEFSR
jgi:flagellar hook-associated protein FlgK